jgi:hypothetical protein
VYDRLVADMDDFKPIVDAANGTRPSTVFDEIVRCCYAPLKGLDRGSVQTNVVRNCVLSVLRFTFGGGETSLGGSTFTSFKLLIDACLKLTVQAHALSLAQLHYGTESPNDIDVERTMIDKFQPWRRSDTTDVHPEESNIHTHEVRFHSDRINEMIIDPQWVFSAVDDVNTWFTNRAYLTNDETGAKIAQMSVDLFRKRGMSGEKVNDIEFMKLCGEIVHDIVRPDLLVQSFSKVKINGVPNYALP